MNIHKKRERERVRDRQDILLVPFNFYPQFFVHVSTSFSIFYLVFYFLFFIFVELIIDSRYNNAYVDIVNMINIHNQAHTHTHAQIYIQMHIYIVAL